jgi:hypothetical protein
MSDWKLFYDDNNYTTDIMRYFIECNLKQQYAREFLLEHIPIPTLDRYRCTIPSYRMQYTPRAPVFGPEFAPSTIEYQSATLFSPEDRKKWFPHASVKNSRLSLAWTPEEMAAADAKTPSRPAKSPRKLRTWGSEDDDEIYVPTVPWATSSTPSPAPQAESSPTSSVVASSSTTTSYRSSLESAADSVLASIEQHITVGESSDMEGSDDGSGADSDTDCSAQVENGSVSSSDSDSDNYDVGFTGALRSIRRSESVEVSCCTLPVAFRA